MLFVHTGSSRACTLTLGGRCGVVLPHRSLISWTTRALTILSPCYFDLIPKTCNPVEHGCVTAQGPGLPYSLCPSLSVSLCQICGWLNSDDPSVLVSFSQLMWGAVALGSCGPTGGWAMGNENSTTDASVRPSSRTLGWLRLLLCGPLCVLLCALHPFNSFMHGRLTKLTLRSHDYNLLASVKHMGATDSVYIPMRNWGLSNKHSDNMLCSLLWLTWVGAVGQRSALHAYAMT